MFPVLANVADDAKAVPSLPRTTSPSRKRVLQSITGSSLLFTVALFLSVSWRRLVSTGPVSGDPIQRDNALVWTSIVRLLLPAKYSEQQRPSSEAGHEARDPGPRGSGHGSWETTSAPTSALGTTSTRAKEDSALRATSSAWASLRQRAAMVGPLPLRTAPAAPARSSASLSPASGVARSKAAPSRSLRRAAAISRG